MSDEIKEVLKGIDKKTIRRLSRPKQKLIEFLISVYDSDSSEENNESDSMSPPEMDCRFNHGRG